MRGMLASDEMPILLVSVVARVLQLHSSQLSLECIASLAAETELYQAPEHFLDGRTFIVQVFTVNTCFI